MMLDKMSTYIREHEIGLWFRRDDFRAVLRPGKHRVPGILGRFRQDRVEVCNRLDSRVVHPLLDVLISRPDFVEHVEVIDLRDDERGFLWKNGRFESILGPGRHVFWKEPHVLRVEQVDTASLRFEHPKSAVILEDGSAKRYFETVEVPSGFEGLLYRDGELTERLPPGRHVFWKGCGALRFPVIDRREQVLDANAQEILTADKVTLRINLVVTFRVVDIVQSVTVVHDAHQTLYREAQLALRGAVGERTLDKVLGEKEALGEEVRKTIVARAAEFGVRVEKVGVRDIILPGDMKTILNQVIEAQKQAEANVIRRREETAAARSQANTAKLLAENPVLARMKELEALQEILAGTKSVFVFGQGDIGGQLGKLVAQGSQEG